MEEEINRLFRTSAFNKIKRQHQLEDQAKQFPELIEIKINRNSRLDDKLLTQLQMQQKLRSKIPKHGCRLTVTKEESDIRPLFINQTAGQSIKTRSPLIGMIYPTPQEQLYQFHQQVKRSNLSKSLQKTRKFNNFLDISNQENQINKSNLDQRRVQSSYCSRRNDLPNNSINFRQIRTGINFYKQKS